MDTSINVLDDGTIVDSENRILYYSLEKFVSDIVKGSNCFICGAHPEEKRFNDEHVIPEWVLRRYKLHDRRIELPNRQLVNYSQYKVPCCVDCNSMLGNEIEEPISKIIGMGIESISIELRKENDNLFFKWMCLLFFKLYLKDKSYRFHLDYRENDLKISEVFDWEDMHHIHCIVRSVYTKCKVSSNVIGTMLLRKVKVLDDRNLFDIADVFPGKTLLIRLGEILILGILNDSKIATLEIKNTLDRIEGDLNPLQARELLAIFSYSNLKILDRPTYYSDFDKYGIGVIGGSVPSINSFISRPTEQFLKDNEYSNYGFILYNCVKDAILNNPDSKADIIAEQVKKGRWSCLFDDNGIFIYN